MTPQRMEDLTPEQKNKVLEYVGQKTFSAFVMRQPVPERFCIDFGKVHFEYEDGSVESIDLADVFASGKAN